MNIKRILIANRGEIAIRIMRGAAELGVQTIAVCSEDDTMSLHNRMADKVCQLTGDGAAAYLDAEQIIALAKAEMCEAIHPGYGFLSENAMFARRCAAEGLIFIGPSPELLELFGDKARARSLAIQCGVPVLPGTQGATNLEEARRFMESLGRNAGVMVKAMAGGGGRGMRSVEKPEDLEEAYERCRSEAIAAFGKSELFVEKMIRRPRHIEVQIIGDGCRVIDLGERDCTLQRRHQKIIEIAPSPALKQELREAITDAALRIARKVHFTSLGTFEFLLATECTAEQAFTFMEVNPRIQVEHPVTEEVGGIDLVVNQIQIAQGKTLEELGILKQRLNPGKYSIQLRINTEKINERGDALPESGTLTVYEAPSGPGIRVDGYGYKGFTINSAFDSLLAKLIVTSHSPRFEDAVAKAYRALTEFNIEGVGTNIPFLLNLMRRNEIAVNSFHTRFIEENAAELAAADDRHRRGFFSDAHSGSDIPTGADQWKAPAGTVAIVAAMKGRMVEVRVCEGSPVSVGQTIAIVEAMKMEHIVKADRSGYVQKVCVERGTVVLQGAPLVYLIEADVVRDSLNKAEEINLDVIRTDLRQALERHALALDENRPEAAARRHLNHQRTARENVEDLCDTGTFVEYGALVIAAQRRRRSLDELIEKTAADGLICGIGTVNGAHFGAEKSRCMIMAYDFTVLAGTQGIMGHKKMDRMLRIAHQWKFPTVLFAEGGGGRPGDTDMDIVAGLDCTTFHSFAGLSGKAPLVGIVEGMCFAGNAALLGCCDVIIATRRSSIGMGGPAMIEGGGLGVVKAEEVGPVHVQSQNGVIDIVVNDEEEAVAAAKKYLSYFQGVIPEWQAEDQRILRWLIPENRLRIYEVRSVIENLADRNSVLELRRDFSPGMITSLIRIEGRPFGLIANNPRYLAGAIDAAAADKAVRFMHVCNSHGLPIVSLCDTPGFMVGPEAESMAHVRHVCRMFLAGANITVPFFAVVLRKGYGLGAMAMCGGGFHFPFFTASWPTGEFGAMGLEGAVKHAYKRELQAIQDPDEYNSTYKNLVDQLYSKGKAINVASYMEIDSLIDPADTRRWILRGINTIPASGVKKPDYSYIDAW